MAAVSSRQWLTGDIQPGDLKCFRVFCPSGEAFEAALRGAIAQLERDENWDDTAEVLPETVANAFREASALTMQWKRCGMIGSVILWPSATIPDDFAVCDGSVLAIDDYPELFAVLGVTWGGNGTTEFNLPDMRQRVPIAVGAKSGLTARAVGDSGGEEKHTLTSGEHAAHIHTVSPMMVTASQVGAGFAWGPAAGYIWTGAQGNNTPHENMPPFSAVNFIIQVR